MVYGWQALVGEPKPGSRRTRRRIDSATVTWSPLLGADRPAARRAGRASMERRRLGCRRDPCAQEHHARRRGYAQIPAVISVRAHGGPSRRRAGTPLATLGLPRRRRQGVLPPPHRQPTRRGRHPRFLLRGDACRRNGPPDRTSERDHVPFHAAHVRDAHGRCWRADAGYTGVDGPQRHPRQP